MLTISNIQDIEIIQKEVVGSGVKNYGILNSSIKFKQDTDFVNELNILGAFRLFEQEVQIFSHSNLNASSNMETTKNANATEKAPQLLLKVEIQIIKERTAIISTFVVLSIPVSIFVKSPF
jgi:hypothetical protein